MARRGVIRADRERAARKLRSCARPAQNIG